MKEIGKKIINIGPLVDIFKAQEGEIRHISGKIGNGKTYEATRQARNDLYSGKIVYTTWQMILPEYYDEREDKFRVLWNLLTFKKNFYRFNFKKNWHHLDIDRPDLVEFVANLTDCVVYLDEGQDIFDSYEGRAMSLVKRKSLTRTRHLRKTLVIISQRPQAVAVTARANVTWFYKCVKTWSIFRPWSTLFKVYRTEEMDDQNMPIWEKPLEDWRAELWHTGFAKKEIFNMYDSWYLSKGIVKSQEIYFDAYELDTFEKLLSLIRPKSKIALAVSEQEMIEKARQKQLENMEENRILTRKKKVMVN